MRALVNIRKAGEATTPNDGTWREIFDRYSGRIYTYAFYRLNGDHDEAETVVSETFVAAARTARNLGVDRPLEGWLYTIARSKLMDVLRRRRKHRLLIDRFTRARAADETDRRPTPSAILENRELSLMVAQAMAALPERYRIALSGRYLDGVGVGEIARRIGCAPTAVDGIVFRARKALAGSLKARGAIQPRHRFAQSA